MQLHKVHDIFYYKCITLTMYVERAESELIFVYGFQNKFDNLN